MSIKFGLSEKIQFAKAEPLGKPIIDFAKI